MSASRRDIRSMFWALLDSGGVSLLSLLTILVLARVVGPKEIGIAGIALAIVQTLALGVEALFHDAIVQRQKIGKEHLHSVFWVSIGLGVLASAGCWLVADLVASVVGEPRLGPVLVGMSLCLVLNSTTAVLVPMLRREMEFKILARRSIVGRVIGSVAAIVVGFLGFGAWSVVIQHLVACAIGTVVLWRFTAYRPALFWSATATGQLLGFAIPSFFTLLLWSGLLRLLALFIGVAFGATAVGYFSIATRMADTSRGLLSTALYHVSLSIFSRENGERARLQKRFAQASRIVCLITLPVFAGLAVCSEFVIELLLNDRWLPAAPLVTILAVDAMLLLVAEFYPSVLSSMGRPQLNIIPPLIGGAAVFAVLLLFEVDSPVAAVLLWTARHLIVLPLQFVLLRNVLGFPIREQIANVSAPLIAVALMVVFLGAFYPQLRELGAAAALGLCVPAGVLAYGATIYSLRRSLLTEALDLVWASRGSSLRL